MSVRKRKFKNVTRWFVDVTFPDGKRYRKMVGTKKEADQVHRKLEAEIVKGEWGIREARDIKFSALADRYLEYAEANKATSTYRGDKCRIECHLLPYFGKKTLKRITSQMVESYKQMRIRDGVSHNTVNHELTNLSHMMNMAVRWGYIDRNIVSGIERMKVAEKTPRFLSQDEIDRLVKAAENSHIYPLIMTALHTGMRKSELFNLKWSDVDFQQGTVTVQSKADWHTKNYRSRTIQLTPVLYDVLSEHRLLHTRLRIQSEYVFTYNGHKLKSNIKKSFGTVLKMANLENVTLHTLRHTFASQLAMAGVSLREIQVLMGHRSFETTLQYAHLSEDHVKKQVLKLPFANGSGSSAPRERHAEVIFIDTPKKEEPHEVASSQGS